MDSNKPAITGVKKRQQIHKANRTVFLWVAIAGVIVAIAVVLSQFMIKQLIFNWKIIDHETKANATLVENAKAYTDLRAEITKLLANKELNELRVNKAENGDNALQVVIDAMPTVDDRIALAAALQQSIISKSGVKLDSLGFTDGGSQTDATGAPVSTAPEGVSEIPFNFKVSGTYDQVKKLFADMQLSIRPVSVTGIKLSGTSNALVAEIDAKMYYGTPVTTDLKQKKETP